MRGYCENQDGDVVLTMSREDFDRLLIFLGRTTGDLVCHPADGPTLNEMMRFMNRINVGNSRWWPIEVSHA